MRVRQLLAILGTTCALAVGARQAPVQGQRTEPPAPAAAPAPAGTEAPQAVFSGQDSAGRNPETFSLNKEKGIGAFTTFGPTGQLIYDTNTLKYISTDANNFAYYEAEGLEVEFAFLTKGPQLNPVYTRAKGAPAWRIEGNFGRYQPHGNYFKP